MKRPILYITIPFCLGIVIARFLNVPLVYTVVLSAAFLAFAILKSDKNILSHILLYLAVFFFGMAYYGNSTLLPADHISRYVHEEPERVMVRGVVCDDPVTGPAKYGKEKTVFTIRAEELGKIGTVPAAMASTTWGTVPIFRNGRSGTHSTRNNHSGTVPIFPVKGLVKVSAYSDKGADVSFGDELILEGTISRPHGLKNPGLFDYEEYLAMKSIYAVLRVKEDSPIRRLNRRSGGLNLRYGIWYRMQKSAYRSRGAVRNIFDRYLKPPYNGFVKAILIGDRTGLSENLKDDFVKTGTVHILAISGLHVGLMSGIVLAFFAFLRLPKKVNLVLSGLVLIFYSFAAGSSPPIVRAVIIFCVFVVGRLISRKSDLLNSLAFAAFLMLLWRPAELFDPSFQLSFVSVASIIIFTPKIDALFRTDSIEKRSRAARSRRYFLKAISVSIAAWLGTWPFVASYFNIISPASILANLVVIPMLFLVMALALIFLSASAVLNLFAKPLGYVLCMTEKLLFWLNRWFAAMPFAYFRIGKPSLVFVILYYTFIAALLAPGVFRLGRIKIEKAKIIAVLLIFFNMIIWSDLAADSNRKELRATFLDVGHGDSIFMELPGAGNILIDGGVGGESDSFDAGRSVVASYLWNKGVSYIDAVVVTHFHADHLGGVLYILKNFRVGTVIDNGGPLPENKITRDYLETIRKKGIRRITVGEGDEIGPFGEVRFFVLNPEKRDDIPEQRTKRDENDDSIVLKLVYKNFSMLLCGDIMDGSMKRLTGTYGKFLKSNVMKVPHHGSGFKDGHIVGTFFQTASPEISVISLGNEDHRKAPSSRMSQIATYSNTNSYNTKTYGAVIISSDGNVSKALLTIVKKNRLFHTLP